MDSTRCTLAGMRPATIRCDAVMETGNARCAFGGAAIDVERHHQIGVGLIRELRTLDISERLCIAVRGTGEQHRCAKCSKSAFDARREFADEFGFDE